MLKAHYQTFFAALGDAIHVTAHSHHPWPDVTRAAHLEYWGDSARTTNQKWDKIFGEVIPEAQVHLGRHLGLKRSDRISFAPNTHEFVMRLYSCFDPAKPVRVLTTGSEFHSFGRQTKRLEEAGCVQVTRVPVEPYATFGDRFIAAARADEFDMVFLSHVFFDSGFVVRDLPAITAAVKARTMIVIDGYHALFAIPVDLRAIADRVFYLGGGYKYLQAGEGACFMAVPPETDLRPIYSGWFSDFGKLSNVPGKNIGYGENALHYWGSTFDASGIYRLNAVMRLYRDLGVDGATIHAHVETLQARFLEGLARDRIAALPIASLVPGRALPRGNFCTFDLDRGDALEAALSAKQVFVDRRGRRVRFGFGVYHDATDIDRLLDRLRALAT